MRQNTSSGGDMIYLDNAATTKPIDITRGENGFFNPSAFYANVEKERLKRAREKIASLIGAEASEIYFTSSATIANNLAIFGSAHNKKATVLSSLSEHESVYRPLVELQNRGYSVEFVPKTSFNQKCGFASVIHVSNETGAINDIAAIVKTVKAKNPSAIFHSDGVQAFCKNPVDVKKLGVDLYTISGHKVGGKKGVGAIYIKKGINLRPLFFGGGQEGGNFPGTENLEAIENFASASEIFFDRYKRVDFTSLKNEFLTRLESEVEIKKIAGGLDSIFAFSITGVKAEILQRVLAEKDKVFVGLGSACSGNKKGNRVLSALGLSKSEVEGSIRISFSIDTKPPEVIEAVEKIVRRVQEWKK